MEPSRDEPVCRGSLPVDFSSAGKYARDSMAASGTVPLISQGRPRGKGRTKDMGRIAERGVRVWVVVLALAGLIACEGWLGTVAEAQATSEMIEELRIDPNPPQSGDKVSIVIKLGMASPAAKVQVSIDGKVVKEFEYDRDRPPVVVETALEAGNKVEVKAIPMDINGHEGTPKTVTAVCAKAPPSVKLGQQKLDGNYYSAQVVAKDADGKPVTVTLKEGPQGMKLSPDGTITWNFPQGTTGRFGVSVVAKDADGAETMLSFSFSLSMSGGK